MTFINSSINRDPFTGANQNPIIYLNFGNWDINLLTIHDLPGSFRLQSYEPFNGLGSFTLGPGFQQPAQKDKSDDHRGRLEIDMLHLAGKEKGKKGNHAGINVC